MKTVPIYRVRNCINLANLVETRLSAIFEILVSEIPNSNFVVDGIGICAEENKIEHLRITALRRTYALAVSYCYSDDSGPLGIIALCETLPPQTMGDPIFQLTVDSNGSVRCSDETGFNLFEIGRGTPVDQARSNLLYKFLGAIVASLPPPPVWTP